MAARVAGLTDVDPDWSNGRPPPRDDLEGSNDQWNEQGREDQRDDCDWGQIIHVPLTFSSMRIGWNFDVFARESHGDEGSNSTGSDSK